MSTNNILIITKHYIVIVYTHGSFQQKTYIDQRANVFSVEELPRTGSKLLVHATFK